MTCLNVLYSSRPATILTAPAHFYIELLDKKVMQDVVAGSIVTRPFQYLLYVLFMSTLRLGDPLHAFCKPHTTICDSYLHRPAFCYAYLMHMMLVSNSGHCQCMRATGRVPVCLVHGHLLSMEAF